VRERRDAGGALALAASLTWLWYFDGLYREGLGWMNEAMQLPGARAPTPAAAAVLSGMARLAGFSGEMALAHQQAAQSIERWRALGDRRGLGFALFHQALPALVTEGRDAAVSVLHEARQCFSDVADAWGVALATVYEGVVRSFHPGDEAAAERVLKEGLVRSQALGDEWAASTCTAYLGSVALRRGDYATARRGFTHILGVARQTGDRFRTARSAHLLGELDLIEGRHAEALAQMAEALTLAQEQGRMADAPQLLRGIARALVGLAQHAQAATLFGASARSDGPRSTLPPEDAASAAAAHAACRTALGEDLFDSHWQAGAVLPNERAIQQAQAWALAFRPLGA
jgi:tetratricopeptide (TPR) repeat protein